MLPSASTSTPEGNSRPVEDPPIVRSGAALPLSVVGYSLSDEPNALATSRLPLPSKAIASGSSSPVALPEIVAVGGQLPFAPGGHAVRLSLEALVTPRAPAATVLSHK